MNASTCRIGFWSAVISTVFGLLYITALVATLAGAVGRGPWATAFQLAPSIVLAWSYMVLMACILDAAPLERRIWAIIGFGFALMYSVINSIVYFTVLTVVLPKVLRNEGESVSVLLFEPGEFLFAVNGLAYGFMSMAALFAAQVFPARLVLGAETTETAEQARVHRAMLTHGVIGPFIVGAVLWPPLTAIGALWIVTFPVMGISLAIMFQKANKAKSE